MLKMFIVVECLAVVVDVVVVVAECVAIVVAVVVAVAAAAHTGETASAAAV